ncbi:MAG: glutathione S-transferase [Paracoccaceae bacterium]|jgi:glutathione S-transferase
MKPILYSFRRCPYAMRARLAIAASGVQVELREILLRDKAPELMAASPKATVPVIVNEGDVIDESYDIMLWALEQNDPDAWLDRLDPALIAECDSDFKFALDKYKYGSRFEGSDAVEQRGIASGFLIKLDNVLASRPYLSGADIGMTDMSIATFVRQFANVDRTWFDAQPWPNLIRWLEDFLSSDAFTNIMAKYPKWQASDAVTLFPEQA